MNDPLVEKINVDDNEYITADLPDPIRGLVSLYQEASTKMVEAQRQAGLMEAARKSLGDSVIASVRQWNVARVKELEAKAASAAAMAAQVANDDTTDAPVAPVRKLKALPTVDAPDSVQ